MQSRKMMLSNLVTIAVVESLQAERDALKAELAMLKTVLAGVKQDESNVIADFEALKLHQEAMRVNAPLIGEKDNP